LYGVPCLPHAAAMSEHPQNSAADPTPERALALLDERYRRPLLAYFRRRLGTPADAEDLTQDVFERLLKELRATSVLNAEALIFRIAINLLRDRFRRQRTRGTPASLSSEDATEFADALAVDLSPERVVMGEMSLQEVDMTLRELGERTRAIFYLYRLENLKVREIAELYGISASAIEKQIAKALLHLTRRLRTP
jgi:RNA polymerase sigma-70 factor (ECF subfamily)